MHTLSICIADHRIRIDVISNELKAWLQLKFAALIDDPRSAAPADLHITITEEDYGEPFDSFEVTIMEEDGYVFFSRKDYLIQVSGDFSKATLRVYNDIALNHALMSLYSGFITHHEWGLMTHSSCMVDHGNAHLFAGQSGAGKSTAALLSYPRQILSDEAAILKVEDGKVEVFNSPFRSDSFWDHAQTADHYELKGCHLLKQSQEIKRTPIAPSDALVHLMNTVFYWAYRADETAKVFQLGSKVVKAVPFYELYFQKNALFWDEIHE